MEIKYAAKTKVTLTASEWQLYDTSPGVEKAVEALNQVFSKAINEGWAMVYEGSNYQKAAYHIEHTIGRVMEEYSNYGATDSEPQQVVRGLTKNLFNKEFVDFIVSRNPDYKPVIKLNI